MSFIHELADVQSNQIGQNTRIWQFAVVLPGAVIGENCNICAHTFIENDVIIGNSVTIKAGVQIWDGIEIADDVFIGPNATFTNDRFPRSRKEFSLMRTTICKGASLGAGAVILPGLVIGEQALVGAGAVLTRSVPPYAVVVGNPARIVGYVDASAAAQMLPLEAPPTEKTVGSVPTRVKGVRLYRLPFINDLRGDLTVGEFEKTVPFTPRRYFLVLDVPSRETRGEHAHRECREFLICVCGSCAVVADDGVNRQEFLLDRPDVGLYLPPMVWRVHYKYSVDTVLLAFASHYYDEADYIRNYKEFRQLLGVDA